MCSDIGGMPGSEGGGRQDTGNTGFNPADHKTGDLKIKL